MSPLQRVLRRVLIIETSHPFLTLLVALLLTALSITYTVTNLEFETGQKDLISPENRLVKLSDKIDQFDNLDTFVVAIENQNPASSLAFLHALCPILEADHENYIQVFYRVDPKLFRPWALLYLEDKDLISLRNNLQEHHSFIENLLETPNLSNFFREINSEMASKMVGRLFTGFLDESLLDEDEKPLDLNFLLLTLRELKKALDGDTHFTLPWEYFFSDGAWDNDLEEGYFWTENKKYLLVFVTPRKIDSSFVNSKNSLIALRKTIAYVQADFPDIKVGVTGQEALKVDEMGIALHDMILATIISLACLTTLLVLFWRGLRRPLLEIAELLVALSLTFGLTTLFIGHLNILSVTFAPLILGLGIDYGIHWFARYQEEEQLQGMSKREAIEATMIKLGPGIILASLTAALSFFPLVLTGFKGLVELGIITSMGMVMTTFTTLGLLPALTLLFDKPKEYLHQTHSPSGVKPFLRLTNGKAVLFLIPGLILLSLASWEASKVNFDLNMLNLQSKSAEAVIWEKKLLENSKRSSMYGAILASSIHEVKEKTAALKALSSVSEVKSIEDLLPDDQKKKIDILAKIKPLLTGVGPLSGPSNPINITELEKILSRMRFKMLDSEASKWGAYKPLESQMFQVRDLIDQIRHRFRSMENTKLLRALGNFENALIEELNDKFDILHQNVNTRPMQLDDLPKALIERFVNQEHLYLIRVFPADDIWEPKFLGRFVHDLESVDPDVIGDPVTLYTFTKAFRDACIKAAVYAVIFITVLLLMTSRSLIHTLLVMTPLAVGTSWTLGFMKSVGLDLNLANSIFVPLVVGKGVEYGIIIVQRWQQTESANGNVILPFSTAKGVILAGLTTAVGFASLTISDHQGIFSLGLFAMVGSLSILTAAILFLPALLQFVTRFQKGRELRRPPIDPIMRQDMNR